ncbi:hypothetical protein ACFOYW_14335 [Gryllotalpicola reticulitermitis]|uniref:Uncharacterized protein n=1 Tax=Gryllotalpicola reticulitermitis TaxID=1184153 RepID=A0ABV8Q856_9MICO
MTQTAESTITPESSNALPGGRVLRVARRLMVVAVAASLSCSILLTDGKGAEVGTSTTLVDASMHASPALYIIFGVVLFVAIGRALRGGTDERRAVKTLNHAMLVIAAVAVVAVAASGIYFFAMPVTYWVHHGLVIQPFPFASVHATTSS